MTKALNPRKKTVELQPPARPSRIRREPPPPQKKAEAIAPEIEVVGGMTGVIVFAITIAAIILGVSAYTVQLDSGPAPVRSQQFGVCGVGDRPNCVIDGDTIILADQKVEIAGIEAPNGGSARCPEEAQRASQSVERLLQVLNSGKVTAAGPVRELDGQLRTRVEVNGRDVAESMINAGAARTYGSGLSWCG
ncbi:MAG: thermonuclease family protein [Sphingomicrobium sp.]